MLFFCHSLSEKQPIFRNNLLIQDFDKQGYSKEMKTDTTVLMQHLVSVLFIVVKSLRKSLFIFVTCKRRAIFKGQINNLIYTSQINSGNPYDFEVSGERQGQIRNLNVMSRQVTYLTKALGEKRKKENKRSFFVNSV